MKWLPAIAVLWIALATPASAIGDGGPALPVQGGSGISAPGSPYRYVAVHAGRDATLIKRLGGGGSSPGPASIRVGGNYGIPGVGSAGQLTGLSADGRTLVVDELVQAGVPRTTRLLVLDAPRLAVRASIALPGWSLVDAISPDGRWLYLINYPSAGNLTRYEVRAYDLVTRQMLPRPIVDPRDDDDRDGMVGFPVTRVISANGRWAYTLYIRASGAPFIHALDTVGVRARCVDLPSSLAQLDIGDAHLSLGAAGKTVRIVADGVTQAVVDTRTFVARVVRSAPLITEQTFTTPTTVAHAVTRAASAEAGDSGGFTGELIVAAGILAAIGGAVRLRTRAKI
ncbi:MAG TPA: hypothetical protein VMB27_16190 [Solirubrobacteraceae bacterium]|nr:hypothetical protein [Solirubrobacteraceae bacterium]